MGTCLGRTEILFQVRGIESHFVLEGDRLESLGVKNSTERDVTQMVGLIKKMQRISEIRVGIQSRKFKVRRNRRLLITH